MLDCLRVWLNDETIIRCDGSFFGVSFCIVGRLIGVEAEAIALVSADTRAELAFDPRAADRFERGRVAGMMTGASFGDGITAFLPADNHLTFSVADPVGDGG